MPPAEARSALRTSCSDEADTCVCRQQKRAALSAADGGGAKADTFVCRLQERAALFAHSGGDAAVTCVPPAEARSALRTWLQS